MTDGPTDVAEPGGEPRVAAGPDGESTGQGRPASWTPVCPYRRLEPERGVAALVGGEQVAVFRTHDGRLFAIGHRDPIAGAYVMARGIVGSRGEIPTVASPLHKQVYDLRTGDCLDVSGVTVPTYPVRCRDGLVEVAARHRPAGGR
ncbi:nitrite reductase small subunit NirD [Plantactinospora sp. WMMB334]|uniref:nitrite reductase small subunit NirD n=1 Tax=Plantactinospora sp. WMMB334 TaxID=3404119 RepID=UPI003B956F57